MRTVKTWLATIAMLLCSLSASAYDFEVGGIYYNILSGEDKTVAVINGYDYYSGSVSIPNSVTYNSVIYSVTSIGNSAFESCYGLTSITIPNSVTSIGNNAFYDCYGLTSITIPNSVTSIEDNSFVSCYGLTSIVVEEGNSVYDSRNNCNAIIETSTNTLLTGCKNTIIPNSVTSIGSGAFFGCSGLTSITIPNSVTSIGEAAFYGCEGLTSITLSNSVTSIGEDAFGRSGLTSITIPNSVTSIGDYVFCHCEGLASITIPNRVTSIGSGAFSYCYGLTSITIPNSVTSIGNKAFECCSGLTSITILNSVTSIGSSAFWGCSGLTSITIPNSVTSIGSGAFSYCQNLLNVYCYAENVPSADSYVFANSYPGNATLHVPATALESYKSTSPWSSFGNIVALPPSEVALEDGVEYENTIEAENVPQITYTRTLSKTNTWNALYVPFEIPMTEEFLEDYDVAYFNDIHSFDNYIGDKENNVLGQDGVIDGMEMEVLKVHEGDVLNANYPYLIRAKNTDALNMNIVVEDATLYQAKETTISCSSVFMRFDVTGIYTTQTAGELKGEFDVYAMSGGGWKQALNPSQQLKPFRLYLSLSTIDGSPVKVSESAMSRINIRVQGEDTETSILETESGEAEIDIFDLSGRRVQNTQKGLYIVNGKKVIVK